MSGLNLKQLTLDHDDPQRRDILRKMEHLQRDFQQCKEVIDEHITLCESINSKGNYFTRQDLEIFRNNLKSRIE